MEHTKGELGISSSFLIVDKNARIIANVEPIGVPGITTTYEEGDANAKELVRRWNSQPDLLAACKNALADLEGILPEYEPSGERQHPGWLTIAELRTAIKKAK